MPKITDEPLEAIQVRLFKKDLDELRKVYSGQIGVNKAIRTLVRSFVNQLRAKTDRTIDDLNHELEAMKKSTIEEGETHVGH